MRILLASDSFEPSVGGVQRVVRDLGDGLVAAGHDVRVLAPQREGEPERDALAGLVVERVRLGRPAARLRAVAGFARRLAPARARVAELYEAFRPDVAHLHFLQSPLAYLVPHACARRAVPLVATAHGRDVVGDMVTADAIGRRAVTAVLRRAAAVTAPSEATLRDARALAPDAGGLFRAVPNALPADMAEELERRGAGERTGVVAVGELHRKKGFDVLVRAVAALPDVSLTVAGRGEEEPALRALIGELGAADRIRLAGFVPRDDLVALLRGAAVQAVPSRREPFGLVILEGMACGTPVVASRTDGIPEVVGDAAVLVEPGDHEALTAVLARVLGDAAERTRLAAAGRARAALHTRERTTEAYLDVYRGAIAAREERP